MWPLSVVAILGASDNPGRYSFLAMELLLEKGYEIKLVNPRLSSIAGHPCVPSLDKLSGIHTLTIYVNPEVLEKHEEAILKLRPQRVIMNPGSESENLRKRLEGENIEVIEGCTLVMLRSGQF
jgi:uncharacterized protein